MCRDSRVDTLAGLRIAAGGSGCGCGWGWRPWRGKVPEGSQSPQPLVFGGAQVRLSRATCTSPRLVEWGARQHTALGHGGPQATTQDQSGHRRSSETPDAKLPAEPRALSLKAECLRQEDTSDSGSFIFQPDTEDRELDMEAEGGLCA